MAKQTLRTFLVLLTVAYCHLIDIANAWTRSSFSAYETKVNTFDDGKNVVTTYQNRQLPLSSQFLKSRSFNNGPLMTQSSWNNMVLNPRLDQALSNDIKFDDDDYPLKFGSSWRTSFDKRKSTKKFKSSARTVESPALSVDTGGRSSVPSVAGEIAKMLHVKQGYYSDIYDQFDRPALKITKPSTTRRPVDMVEEAARRAVVMMFQNRENTKQ